MPRGHGASAAARPEVLVSPDPRLYVAVTPCIIDSLEFDGPMNRKGYHDKHETRETTGGVDATSQPDSVSGTARPKPGGKNVDSDRLRSVCACKSSLYYLIQTF